jgi:hypothetical protein
VEKKKKVFEPETFQYTEEKLQDARVESKDYNMT